MKTVLEFCRLVAMLVLQKGVLMKFYFLQYLSFEQSLYSSVSRSVQAGDSRAIQRLMLQVAGTMFLQSYRAGKYYNYDRDAVLWIE
jgi:hypothetical protein